MVIGAISWGIWAFFRIDIMPTLFGIDAGTVIYAIIGVSGVYGIFLFIEFIIHYKEMPDLNSHHHHPPPPSKKGGCCGGHGKKDKPKDKPEE